MASVKAEKIWADAIRKAVKGYLDVEDEDGAVKKMRCLNVLAETLCVSAAEGDVAAMKEIGDRLDGKPSQAVEVNQRVTLIDLLGQLEEESGDFTALEGGPAGLRDTRTAGNA